VLNYFSKLIAYQQCSGTCYINNMEYSEESIFV